MYALDLYLPNVKRQELLRDAEKQRLVRLATTAERIRRFCLACFRSQLLSRFKA